MWAYYEVNVFFDNSNMSVKGNLPSVFNAHEVSQVHCSVAPQACWIHSIPLDIYFQNSTLRSLSHCFGGSCLVRNDAVKIVILWYIRQRLWVISFACFSTSFCSALLYFRNYKAENYFSWKLSLLVIQEWFVFVIQMHLCKSGYGNELYERGGWA